MKEVLLMTNDIANDSELQAAFQEMMPEIAEGFEHLAGASFRDGQLSAKTKELIAVGVATAMRCEDCMNYHLEKLVSMGAAKAEILEAMGVGFEMGAGTLLPPLRRVIYNKLKG